MLSAKMRAFMNHPAGPFTIFFWCPFVKWGITITNLKDIDLPTKQINSYQQTGIRLLIPSPSLLNFLF